jgi:O-antigen/teichoic acid export membrane protein
LNMSITKTIAKNTMFGIIATACDAVAMLVVGIVLARNLGTEQYGLYSLMMWFLSLAGLVVNLGIGEMTKRFAAEAIGQQNNRAVKGIVRLSLIVRLSAGLFASLLILGLSSYLARLFGGPASSSYFMLMAVMLLPYVLFVTLNGIFAGFQKYEYGAALTLMVSPLRAVLVIIFGFVGIGVKGVLTMYGGLWVLAVILGIMLLKRLLPLKDLMAPSLLEPKQRNSALKYSLAITGILGVDYFLWQQAEVMFLGMYRPVADVGFYNMAYKIPAAAIESVPYVFGLTLLPAISEQFGKGEMDKIKTIYRNAARYLMMLSFPIAIGGIALAKPIITLLYGQDYAPAIIVMQIVFIPFAMRSLIQSVSSVICGIKEPTFILKIGVILICASIGLNLWLIPKYGIIGAAIASSIPRMIALPFYVRFVSKKIGERWPMGDTLKVILASAIMGVVIFAIQHYFGAILSICIGVPAGIIIYLLVLLSLGSIGSQDMKFLKQIETRLPSFIRPRFSAIIGLVAVFVRH